MAYRVLARTYRPQKLSDVLGQQPIVDTLRSAIEHDRLPHAFLLHGIRGVGKTTTARILAKGLNCAKGITVDPCGVCPSCEALTADKHLDVLEMDAASHTGIDDIREILESLQYKPIMGRFKIFIIDEVHMLSKSAFNALLKTLEEPPDHVKFILATTEIRKIPDTIISRCMRLDLKRFDRADLEAAIVRIAGLEGGEIDADAAHVLSRSADGSMRDALSLLDQAIHMGSKETGFHITIAHVSAMLGLTDQNRIYDLLGCICNAKAFETLELAQNCIKDGADPLLMAEDILEAVYFASIAQLQPQAVPSEARELAKDTVSSFWVRLWQLLLNGYEELRISPHPTQTFEMLMLRACHVSPLPTLNTIVEQLGLPSKEQQKRAFEALIQPILKAYPHARIYEPKGDS